MAEHEPKQPTGDGGNRQIVNQDEQVILDRASAPLRTRTEGYQDKKVPR